ncbi:MAG: hypothetical protein A2285_07080 [Elusimicrobia bacterium RIFOXYA12_FULL_57_11]|nr:MAG: hypothetical protein A2285_07080 [Elusimicrobia bacterium RIFOXYA12_FULL_57_11]
MVVLLLLLLNEKLKAAGCAVGPPGGFPRKPGRGNPYVVSPRLTLTAGPPFCNGFAGEPSGRPSDNAWRPPKNCYISFTAPAGIILLLF